MFFVISPLAFGILPALGGLACGLVCRMAPETRRRRRRRDIEAFTLQRGSDPAARDLGDGACFIVYPCRVAQAGAKGRVEQSGGLGGLVGRGCAPRRGNDGCDGFRRAAGMSACVGPLGSALMAGRGNLPRTDRVRKRCPAVCRACLRIRRHLDLWREHALFARVARFPLAGSPTASGCRALDRGPRRRGVVVLPRRAPAVRIFRCHSRWTRPGSCGLASGARHAAVMFGRQRPARARGEVSGVWGVGSGAVAIWRFRFALAAAGGCGGVWRRCSLREIVVRPR